MVQTFLFGISRPSKYPSFLHYCEKEKCVLLLKKRNLIEYKLKIGVSKSSPKKSVGAYNKVSPDAKVKGLIVESNKVIIIVPRYSVKYERL